MPGALRNTAALRLSVRTQMMVEKMNAFYLKNWDKDPVFDISQRVVARKERQWLRKLAPMVAGNLKQWKWTYTQTPFHKSADGQSPGDLLQSTPKKKWFWIDPPADMFVAQNLPGGLHDFQCAWGELHKELERAAYSEPEQVFTLLHDLHNEGWTVHKEIYDEANRYLVESRKRRVCGIKPPILLREVKRKERWPGDSPVWEEEWDPIKPYTYFSQANPEWHYKPTHSTDLIHDPHPSKDGPLKPLQLTRMEDAMQYSTQRKRISVEQMRDERYRQRLDQENREINDRWQRTEPPGTDFLGNPENAEWEFGKDSDGVGKGHLLHTDVNYFIELFWPNDNASTLELWKYTADHIMLRHFVFQKTGRTMMEFSEPERFAILIALLDCKKALLFSEPDGDGNLPWSTRLPSCWTDQDYIDLVGEDDYRKFLRIEGRRVDEERQRYLRLWSTEVAQEERLDQVVELTKLKHDDDLYNYGGIFGSPVKVRDRLDRKKWAIREPAQAVQEHERLLSQTKAGRRAIFEEENERLAEAAASAYGDEDQGMRAPLIEKPVAYSRPPGGGDPAGPDEPPQQ